MPTGTLQPSTPAGALQDPRALMAIRNLELRARAVVEGFWTGLHRSPYHGFSAEFTEYRPYIPGDDPRRLDWRLFARSDRFYIKKFEDETNLRCHLLVDNSRSMNFGSLAHSKSQYAKTLAATLAWFLHGQGDAVGLMTFDERLRDFLPARNRPGHLRRLIASLDREADGAATDLDTPLQRVAELIKKRGLVVLISDLLAPIDRLEFNLAGLGARGQEAMLFQVLDPAELEFSFSQSGWYRDLETGRDLYLDPEAARKKYRDRLATHLREIETACRNLGVDYHRFVTDQPLKDALPAFLRSRRQRGKALRHTGINHGRAAS
jgi:uncharacterized protein (DUF58 family)